ncbi:MAG: hypothetical protein M3139_14595, partial [Bacteroidota bacterium]|nr:hypothetical protein [Bacteroidota bacterium]
MSNEIINQNADEQVVAQAPTATTNAPVDSKMEEQTNKDAAPVAIAGTEEQIQQSVEDMPQGGIEGVPFPEFPEVAEPVDNGEPQQTEVEMHDAVMATPHDDFDWTVDKRNVTSYN